MCLADVVQSALLIELTVGRRWRLEDLAGGDALLLLRAEAAREERLGDQRDGHAVLSGALHSPLAGALLHVHVHSCGDSSSSIGTVRQSKAKQPVRRRRGSCRRGTRPGGAGRGSAGSAR